MLLGVHPQHYWRNAIRPFKIPYVAMESSLNRTAPHAIVLIGFMGSGKSHIARSLARDMQRPVIDLDAEMERRAGCSITEVFRTKGEAHFRGLEAATLQEMLNSTAVIATGGGVVTRPENRALLAAARARGARVVYLSAQPETLAARIRRQPGKRPLIDGEKVLDMAETVAKVSALLQGRAPFYSECADFTVATDDVAPPAIVEEIKAKLNP